VSTQGTSTHYWVYVLRFWPEEGSNGTTTDNWRFTLEDPSTKARRGFMSFEALMDFLKTQTDEEEIK
jgi:hypothetical protein